MAALQQKSHMERELFLLPSLELVEGGGSCARNQEVLVSLSQRDSPAPPPHFSSLTEQSAAGASWIWEIFTSSPGIPTSIGIFSSAGIFSADELRLDILSISSSSSERRSATQWAVSRASGSWSQHSAMVAQITATP
ncbi:hypothetical protein EYF80_010983 [Liparis tanakae]|uniref:Uncharacterized protein n=1 Tax=Liparis tanakae TaxID=230148 RepID=A0A4Z2INR0_9TELE|nr:hypothetical protein EYF80_010983 [Liparis tanakae]